MHKEIVCPDCGNILVWCVDKKTLKCVQCCNRFEMIKTIDNISGITEDWFSVYSMRAAAFATRKHKGQMYGNKPFVEHPFAVARYIQKNYIGHTDDRYVLCIAAMLHDTIEDTDTTKDELTEVFDRRIADLVFAVSNEPGKNRKEKFLNTVPKILETPLAIDLKLADRICNISESCADPEHKLLGMYLREDAMFVSNLSNAWSCFWEPYKNLIKEGIELCQK